MALVEDIVEGAASEEMGLATLLRKCLVLAHRLGSKPATDWVEWELNGYPKDGPVPEYRHLSLSIKVNMSDMFRQVNGWLVPPGFLGKHAERLTNFDYRDGIGSIEHILKNANGSIAFSQGNLLLILMSCKFTEMDINSAWSEASSSQIKNILDTVRNRVLRFALNIGKEYPDAEAVKSIAPKEQAKVNQIFYNTIHGSANVIGTASASTVVLNVNHGDLTSLRQELQSHDVSSEDIDDLQRALQAEPATTGANFGPKVAKWLGSMLAKAASGAWKISTDVGVPILTDAIKKYYGMP